MNRLLRFEVRFNSAQEAYRSGDTIRGSVHVECRSPITVLAFSVECLGYSELHSLTDQQQQQQQQAPKRKQHLHLVQNLLLNENRLIETRDFKFELPRWLPHSVEFAGVGFVRYCCRATATFSSAPGDTIHAVAFVSVVEDVDLNSANVLRLCSEEENCSTLATDVLHKLVKCSVQASLRLHKSSFVPGENVHCVLSVHNASGTVQVKQIELRLLQRASVGGSYKREQPITEETIIPSAEANQRYWSFRHKIHIPGVVASSLSNAHFEHPLCISYCVLMCVTLSYRGVTVKELKLGCAIVIGTVPKVETVQAAVQMPVSEAAFVEVSRRQIPLEAGRRSRASSVSAASAAAGAAWKQATGRRISVGEQYRCPQQLYILYCIYYPTISLSWSRIQSIRSILKKKRCSIDERVSSETKIVRSASFCLYETPV